MGALIITNEVTGAAVRLEHWYDLPRPPLRVGARLQTTITHYGAPDQASVQVRARRPEPIPLRGVWDDQRSGEAGRARLLALQLDALCSSGQVLRLQWDDIQVWGLADFTAEHVGSWRVNFSLDFTPIWTKTPPLIRVPSYTPKPSDTGSLAQQLAAQAQVTASAAPEGVSQSLAVYAAQALAAAQNRIADALAALAAVPEAGELAQDTARATARLLYDPLLGLLALRARLRAVDLDSSEVAGLAANAGRRWADTLDQTLREALATIAGWIGILASRAAPVSSRTHTVREGETLHTIALEYFGDISAWAAVADANGLATPLLTVGQVLQIPNEV